jgi:multidrug resistance efflux pump
MTETTTTRPAPIANGELVHRVQQLRLNDQLGAGGAAWLPWVLCAILALAWAGLGIRAYRTGAFAPAPVGAGPVTAAPTTETDSLAAAQQAVPGTIQLEVKGYLVPAQQIAVSPIDVGGRVVELNVVEGQLFAKGDVLARLEDTAYQAQVAEAEASLAAAKQRLDMAKMRLAALLPESVRQIEIAQAEAELKEAEAQRDRAKDQVDRFERLGGGVSEQELRQARFDYQGADARAKRLAASLALLKEGPRQEQKAAAEAEVRSAEADVKAAEARLIQAQWRLDNCIIRAPIDGTVLSKKAELGNLVNPMAFSASTSGGGAVCDMANLADLEVDLEIPERDIGKLKVGQRCRIKADAFPDRVYEGRLDRIMPIANRAKSIVNVRVKVRLPEGEVPGTYLKPEMGAVVSFLAEESK